MCGSRTSLFILKFQQEIMINFKIDICYIDVNMFDVSFYWSMFIDITI